jgi:hypothetical protein
MLSAEVQAAPGVALHQAATATLTLQLAPFIID